jgi:hypothetical protein
MVHKEEIQFVPLDANHLGTVVLNQKNQEVIIIFDDRLMEYFVIVKKKTTCKGQIIDFKGNVICKRIAYKGFIKNISVLLDGLRSFYEGGLPIIDVEKFIKSRSIANLEIFRK